MSLDDGQLVGENKKFEEIITSSWGNCDMLVVFFTIFKHFIDRTVISQQD